MYGNKIHAICWRDIAKDIWRKTFVYIIGLLCRKFNNDWGIDMSFQLIFEQRNYQPKPLFCTLVLSILLIVSLIQDIKLILSYCSSLMDHSIHDHQTQHLEASLAWEHSLFTNLSPRLCYVLKSKVYVLARNTREFSTINRPSLFLLPWSAYIELLLLRDS